MCSILYKKKCEDAGEENFGFGINGLKNVTEFLIESERVRSS